MTAFLMLNCCLPPLSRFTTAPLKGRLKPLLEERWHEVTEGGKNVPYEVNAIFGRPMIAPTSNVCSIFGTSRRRPLRSECGLCATNDRPYELHIFYISHTYNKLPLRGADGGAV